MAHAQESLEPTSTTATAVHGAAETLARDGLVGELQLARIRHRVHEELFQHDDPVRVGRYTVLDRIGVGGMGMVYAAYDRSLDRKVALKLLYRSRTASDDALGRLLHEAKTLAKVSHPNVVQVYDVGEHHGDLFIAMEHVQGTTLGRWLAKGEHSWRQAVDLLLAAGRGLAAAHAEGIVHRDFKPDNVLVGEDGRVRVVDFGVAKMLQELTITLDGSDDEGAGHETTRAVLTRTGTVVGTPRYMAPEQVRGEAIGPWTDQFAFGIVAYEALLGGRPFAGESLQDLYRSIASGQVAPPPAGRRLPTSVRRVVMRALERDPKRRFASIDALLVALERARYSTRRLAGVLGMVGLVAAGGVGFEAWRAREQTHESHTRDLESQRDEESERARQAELELHERADEVTLAEAKLALRTDPTAAVIRLRGLSPTGWGPEARSLAFAANARGIAAQIFEIPEGLRLRRAAAGLVVVEEPGEQRSRLWSPAEGLEWRVDGHVELLMPHARVALTSHADQGRLSLWHDGQEHVMDLRAEDVELFVPSADGTRIGTYASPRLTLWSASDGREVDRIEHREGLRPTLMATDGRRMFTIDEAGQLEVWGPEGSTSLAGGIAGPMELSADGRRLAAIGTAGELYAWDTESLQRLVHDPSPAHVTLALAPDGTHLAVWPRSEAPDRCLAIVSLDDGQRRCLAVPPLGRALLSFSSDGRRLLALTDGAAKVWDVARGVSWSPSMDIPLTDAALEPGGEVLVTLHEDHGTRRLMRWPIPLEPPPTLAGHEARVSELVFTDDGRRLASAAKDGTVRLWDPATSTGEILVHLGAEVTALAAAPDGTLAWSDGARIDVRAPDGTVRALPLSLERVADLAFTDAHALLVVVGADAPASVPARFAVIDLQTDRIGPMTEIRVRSVSFEHLGRGAGEALAQLLHPAAAARLEGETFSFVTKDGSAFIDVVPERRFRATDLATNQQWVLDPQALQPMHTPLPRLHVDRNHLVVVTDVNVVVWDPRAGTTSSVPHHHDHNWITALTISPDGERLVVGDGDGLIHLLRIALPEGEPLRDWAERAVELRAGPGDEP